MDGDETGRMKFNPVSRPLDALLNCAAPTPRGATTGHGNAAVRWAAALLSASPGCASQI